MIPLLTAALLLAVTPTGVGSDLFIGDSRRQAQQAWAAIDDRPVGQAMVDQAQRWLGRPYVPGTLDRLPNERLRIDLTTFDCLLLVKQLLAIVHSRSSDALVEQVRLMRYDGGEVSFFRRHHYFGRWAAAAASRGLVQDITAELSGAMTRERSLRFIGRHSHLYRPMAQAQQRACILNLERQLRVTQTYVPIERLRALTPHLRNGDIFALVTAVPDLDVTHTGLSERRDGRVGAPHAATVPDVIGVTVLRPRDR